MSQPSRYLYGLALVTVATVFWSTAGLFVRLLPLDMWAVLGWRSVFAALSLLIVVAVQSRRRLVAAVGAIGWPGIAAVPVSVVSMGANVVALRRTTVANVMVIYATVPFVAAAMAWAWNGERASGRVLVASGIAIVGMIGVVQGPLWVWLAFREGPGTPALIGGAIVMAAVTYYLVGTMRRGGR